MLVLGLAKLVLVALPLFAVSSAKGEAVSPQQSFAAFNPVSKSPKGTVRSIYREVQLHAPSGLLEARELRRFAPYLSKSLRKKIEVAEACERDWEHQNRGQTIKAPFAWSEFGMFSGGNERASPAAFQIQSIRKSEDGSFKVVVRFRYRHGGGRESWDVVDDVVQENGRFLLNDVSFVDDVSGESSTLTNILSEGCDGPRWVGNKHTD